MSYAKGVDYNCTGSTCYGLGVRDDQFRQCQALINAAMARLGLGSSIGIDGKIGSDTIQALLALVKLPPYMNSPTLAKIKASPRPDTAAALVPELIQLFADQSFSMPPGTVAALSQTSAAATQARALAPMPQSYPASAPAAPSSIAPPSGGVQALPIAPKGRVGWWIAGLTGLAAAGFLLVHVAHRREHDTIEPPP